jgi:hypothetical protein
MNAEKSELETNLEKIFTIDGRGTAKKCKFFLELLEEYDQIDVLSKIRDMSEKQIASRRTF